MTNSNLSSKTMGFTLVELLVSLAIIGVLIGLLLPAVQHVRESARRTSCLSNMRQIGLATLSYEAAHQEFPAGHDESGLSWLAMILPYHEQTTLWDSIWTEADQGMSFIQMTAFRTPINLYSCPTDGRASVGLIGNNGILTAYSSYVGVAGQDLVLLDGVMVDSPIRARDISEGLSNTIMAGERPMDQDLTFGGYLVGAEVSNLLGMQETEIYNIHSCPLGPYQFGPGRIDNFCDVYHYWSLHPGGANFTRADGSVALFPYSATQTLEKMATRAGGEVLDD